MQSVGRYERASALNIYRAKKSLFFKNYILLYETSHFNWIDIDNVVTDIKDHAAKKITFTIFEFLDSHNFMCLL